MTELVCAYLVDDNGQIKSFDTYDEDALPEGAITIIPPNTIIKPRWDKSEWEWVENLSPEEVRETIDEWLCLQNEPTNEEVLGQQMTERELEAMEQGQQITDLEIETMLQGQQLSDFELRLFEMEATRNV